MYFWWMQLLCWCSVWVETTTGHCQIIWLMTNLLNLRLLCFSCLILAPTWGLSNTIHHWSTLNVNLSNQLIYYSSKGRNFLTALRGGAELKVKHRNASVVLQCKVGYLCDCCWRPWQQGSSGLAGWCWWGKTFTWILQCVPGASLLQRFQIVFYFSVCCLLSRGVLYLWSVQALPLLTSFCRPI